MTDFLNLFKPANEWNQNCAIAFKLFGFEVRFYAIFVFLGFVIAIGCVLLKAWKWYKIPTEPIMTFVIILFPVAILGARTWSFIIGDATGNFFNFRNGGLAIQGGVMATTIAGVIFFPLMLRKTKYQVRDELQKTPQIRIVSTWLIFDLIVPAVAIGQVIGRWGNYFNQEVYGKVVTDQGLINFLENVLPWMYKDGSYYQPLFLWESIANFFAFIIIYVGFEFIRKLKAGDLGFIYFTFYGVLRVAMEPLRDSEFEFATSKVISALWISFGILGILINHLVLVKQRNKKIMLILKNEFLYFFVTKRNQYSLWKTNKKHQNQQKSKENIKKLDNQLKWIKDKIKNDQELYFTNKKHYHKTQEELLYYRGK